MSGLTAATLIVEGENSRSFEQGGKLCALAERSKILLHLTKRNPGQVGLEGGRNDGDDAARYPVLELFGFVTRRKGKVCAAGYVGGGHQVHWHVRSFHADR